MPEKDHILVRKTLAGDRNAFGDLVERYGALVHGVILETVRRPDPVEDLVQEVFCKAYEQLSTLRQPARFASWVARMAANQAVSWLREQKTRHRVETESRAVGLIPYPRSPDELFETREEEDLLWAALDRLPPEYRRLVVLYYLENCTQQEMARFLDLSLTTVQWRLFKARRSLEREVKEALYRKVGYRSGADRKLRRKVLASLPLIPFFRPAPSRAWVWGWRALLVLGTAGLVGWLGPALRMAWQEQRLGQESGEEAPGVFRVRYSPRELPALSVLWAPRQPRQGERVHIEVAGMEVPSGEQLFLHYLTDLKHPLDNVVVMTPQRDTYGVELSVPADAAAVFFYASTEEEPRDLRIQQGPTAWERSMQRYRWSLTARDAQDRPARGAAFAQAQMAWFQGAPYAEIMAHWDREIARYPAHFETYERRLATMLWHGDWSRSTQTRVLDEWEVLRERFADQPDFLWWAAQLSGLPADEQEAVYRRLYQRFPGDERADEAAYRRVRGYWPADARQDHSAALEDFIRSFPESPYRDEAYQDLLRSLLRTEPMRAARLADSLIAGSLIVAVDPEKEAGQALFYPGMSGSCPQGTAYSVRFDLFVQQDDPQGALDLARRLAGLGLEDPLPYLYIGRRLAGLESWSLVDEDSPTPPRDRPLAVELLTAALPWTRDMHWGERAGYASNRDTLTAMQEADRGRWLGWARRWRVDNLLSLGACHLEQEQFRQAVSFLEEAAALVYQLPGYTSDRAEIHLLLGIAYERLGEEDAAREANLRAVQDIYRSSSAQFVLEKRFEQRDGNADRLHCLLHAFHPQAPDVVLPDLQGRPVSLADFSGRPVLLAYLRRDGALREHLRALIAWQDWFGDEGVVLGVLEQGRPGERGFRDEALRQAAADSDGLRLLADDGSVYDRYRPGDFTLFLIDRQGCLRLRQDWAQAEFIGDRYGFVRRQWEGGREKEQAFDGELAEQVEALRAEYAGGGDAGAVQ